MAILEDRLRFEGPMAQLIREAETRQEMMRLHNDVSGALSSLVDRAELIREYADRAVSSSSFASVLAMSEIAREAASRTPNLPIEGILAAQERWFSSLTTVIAQTSIRALTERLVVPTPDFGFRIHNALDAVAFALPTAFDDMRDRIPDWAHAIAEDLAEQAEESFNACVDNRSIEQYFLDLLGSLGVPDAARRPLTLILIVMLPVAAEFSGYEWGRWRDGDAQEEVRQREISLGQHVEDLGATLDSLLQIAENPPRPARVIRSAWLRDGPSTTAGKVGAVLAPGSDLIVYERKGGWLRVQVELVPGEVRSGWVFGRLARYR
ncbi:SH3 domain-containing protein [Longimicrobium sp.]|uniref:SH3 domain-containing protein n=1 Tax=Longimicrobium sp. TaxID=2029185 RepID=UPI002ED81397